MAEDTVSAAREAAREAAGGTTLRLPSLRVTGMLLGPALCAFMLSLPAPETMDPRAWTVAALAALMAVLWLTEAVPVAITALIPVALAPLIGAAELREAARPYASPLVFLILGGFALGLAMQRARLHTRVALLILQLSGERADRIVAGVMVATALLSMWISNTATAAMMTPIALSIAAFLAARAPAAKAPLAPALLLGVAIAANIGGMATLIGTPPNAVFAAFMAQAHGREIGFAEWMAFGLPAALILLALAWASLTRVSYRLNGLALEGVASLLGRERDALGPMRAPEIAVAAIFVLTALGWLFRPLIDGLLPLGGLSDAGVAMIAAVALFAVPVSLSRNQFLMDWDAMRELPWGVLLLVGGGLSLGAMIDGSGLAAWLGAQLVALSGAPLAAAILVVALATMAISHIASNTATAAALVPVAAALAGALGVEPAALAAPLALAASCAFMLPVATPPNAIAHGTGVVSTAEMARVGSIVSLMALAVIVAAALIAAALGFGAV